MHLVDWQHWFARPRALALAAVLPVLAALAWYALRRRRRALARLGSGVALEGLLAVRRGRRLLAGLCRGAAILVAVVGVAGPQWGRDVHPAAAPGRDVIVVLDMSRSMLAQDVLGRSSPDRFGRARDAALDLAETVRQRGGHRLALVVFAARPQVLCPLTHDYDHFRESLAGLEPGDPLLDVGPAPDGPPSGTRIGAALRRALELGDPRFPGQLDVILLSDGDDPADDGEWRAGAEAARVQGVAVHVVGIGDPEHDSPIPAAGGELRHAGQPVLTRLREEPLREIARVTHGVYVPARTRAVGLGELFRERIEPLAAREDADDVPAVYRQHYAWFFGAALALLAAELALGDRARRPAPVLDEPAEPVILREGGRA